MAELLTDWLTNWLSKQIDLPKRRRADLTDWLSVRLSSGMRFYIIEAAHTRVFININTFFFFFFFSSEQLESITSNNVRTVCPDGGWSQFQRWCKQSEWKDVIKAGVCKTGELEYLTEKIRCPSFIATPPKLMLCAQHPHHQYYLALEKKI